MFANNPQEDINKEQPILALIQDIKDGRVSPETIDKELRQQCIEVFLAEGYTTSSIAQIFKKTDRTIRRDIEDIRAQNALTPNMDLAKKTIGEMVVYLHTHRAHLMRLARSKDASVAEKSQAEYLAARIGIELVARLQTLGFLPLKPQEIIADVSHYVATDNESSFGELRTQIVEIERISKESGELTPEMTKELEVLKKRIEKAEIQDKVSNISSQTDEKGEK
ncbi:MAG TPA: hypothetical protein ACFYEK_14375 [Candidatus Wunengus sp. YC60]|uniref:hypothetical protein n=1 Tax=Candidatus Wunengus sp. YC60 TaxID=3367697 RepID=UPI004025F5B8